MVSFTERKPAIPNTINPAVLDARSIGSKIENTGARVVLLGNGINKTPPFEQLFRSSLLGTRLGMETSGLSPYEQILLETGNYGVITLCDMDGVLVNPIHGVIDPRERRVSLAGMEFLKKITQASDTVVILTSRIDPEKIRENFFFLRGIIDRFQEGEIDAFPFLDHHSMATLEKAGDDRLGVERGKSFCISRRAEQLRRIITQATEKLGLPYVVYIIGSSFFDRRAVLNLCHNFPEIAGKIVYVDTVHLFF